MLYNTVLSAGMKNLISSGGQQSIEVIRSIVDSHCKNIVLGLIEEEAFQQTAIDYLRQEAHPVIRGYFVALLSGNVYADLAVKVSGDLKPTEKVRLKVFVIDDSRMVLNIYRSFYTTSNMILNCSSCPLKLFKR